MEWTDHPVEILTDAMENAGLKPNFEALAKMREYMDEPVECPPDLLPLDVLDDPIIE